MPDKSALLSNAPSSEHYKGGIEPIEFIESNKLDFHEGSIIKYVSRWRRKDGIKDLHKAKFYIERLIELAEKEEAQS